MTDYVIEEKNRVLMERPEPSFYAKIPKMAQLDLDPYELALYTNYKQTASDNPNGGAWKSNETLAKECHMSPRKITQVRQSLVEKGYIHCQYETSESGKEYSAAIVTIVDVWAKNHARFSTTPIAPRANGIAPDANPRSHDVLTPIAPRANKEELNNKNQKEEKALAPALQEMLDTVKRELKQYGKQAENVAKLLLGELPSKQAEMNLSKPINPEMLIAFCVWWDKKKDRNGQSLTRPRNMGSIKSAVEEWQKTLSPLNYLKSEAPKTLAQRKAPTNLDLLQTERNND